MGSIVSFNRNPKTWPAYPTEKRLRETNEQLISVEYGEFDDDPTGTSPLTIYMRKHIYDNLMNDKYRIEYDRDTAMFKLYDKETNEPIHPIASIIY